MKIRYKKYIEIFDKTKKTCNNENVKKVSTLVNDNHKVSEFLFFYGGVSCALLVMHALNVVLVLLFVQ